MNIAARFLKRLNDRDCHLKPGLAEQMTANRARCVLMAVIMAGVAVRLWTISDRSFWLDEAISYSLAREASWSQMIRRTAGDFHPPLFYLLLCLWSYSAGVSIVGLRLFSVLAAAAAMLGCYLFCRDVFRKLPLASENELQSARWIGVSASALIAASSLHIQWSQEARMYSLVTAELFFSSWTLVRAMRATNHRFLWWIAYVLCATASAYTHNFALLSIGGQALWCVSDLLMQRAPGGNPALASTRPLPVSVSTGTRVRESLLAFGTIAIAYLPWAETLLTQTKRATVSFFPMKFTAGYYVGPFGRLVVPTNSLHLNPAISILAIVGFAITVVLLLRNAQSTCRLVGLMMAVPLVCATAISLAGIRVFDSRYFLFVHIFWLCAAPWLVLRFVSKAYRTTLIGALVVSSLIGHYFYWTSLDARHRLGTGGAAAYVAERQKPGDAVIVTDLFLYFSIRYYLRDTFYGLNSPKFYVPKGTRPSPAPYGASAVAEEWTIDEDGLQNLDANRIWLIGSDESSMTSALHDQWKSVAGLKASFDEAYRFVPSSCVSVFERIALPAQSSVE